MGPYGPGVEENKEAHLRRLKEKYGDYPEEVLLQMAREATEKAISEYYLNNQEAQQRKTA